MTEQGISYLTLTEETEEELRELQEHIEQEIFTTQHYKKVVDFHITVTTSFSAEPSQEIFREESIPKDSLKIIPKVKCYPSWENPFVVKLDVEEIAIIEKLRKQQEVRCSSVEVAGVQPHITLFRDIEGAFLGEKSANVPFDSVALDSYVVERKD